MNRPKTRITAIRKAIINVALFIINSILFLYGRSPLNAVAKLSCLGGWDKIKTANTKHNIKINPIILIIYINSL